MVVCTILRQKYSKDSHHLRMPIFRKGNSAFFTDSIKTLSSGFAHPAIHYSEVRYLQNLLHFEDRVDYTTIQSILLYFLFILGLGF